MYADTSLQTHHFLSFTPNSEDWGAPSPSGTPRAGGEIAPQREFTRPQSNGLLVVIESFLFFREKLEGFFFKNGRYSCEISGGGGGWRKMKELLQRTMYCIVADRIFFKVLTHRVFLFSIFLKTFLVVFFV